MIFSQPKLKSRPEYRAEISAHSIIFILSVLDDRHIFNLQVAENIVHFRFFLWIYRLDIINHFSQLPSCFTIEQQLVRMLGSRLKIPTRLVLR